MSFLKIPQTSAFKIICLISKNLVRNITQSDFRQGVLFQLIIPNYTIYEDYWPIFFCGQRCWFLSKENHIFLAIPNLFSYKVFGFLEDLLHKILLDCCVRNRKHVAQSNHLVVVILILSRIHHLLFNQPLLPRVGSNEILLLGLEMCIDFFTQVVWSIYASEWQYCLRVSI